MKCDLQIRYYVLLLSVLGCITGCATVIERERAIFQLESVPSGSSVYLVSGKLLGRTPLNLKLPRQANRGVQREFLIKKSGYKTTKVIVKPEFNKTALLNIFFWPFSLSLPSFTIDQINQKLYRFDTDSYVLELKRLPKPSPSSPSENAPQKPKDISPSMTGRSIENQQNRLENERKILAKEKAELAKEKLELEKLKLETEKIKLERRKLETEKLQLNQEQEQLNRQKEAAIQPTSSPKPNKSQETRLQKPSNAEQDSPLSPSPKETPSIEDTSSTKEERLLEQMKQRYQQQLKRKQKKKRPRDPRLPAIEIDPLSLWYDSPSQGALPLTLVRYQILLEEFARRGGRSTEELFLRLSLASDHQIEPTTLPKAYRLFIDQILTEPKVFSATHGLELYRAVKPIHAQVIIAMTH